MLGIGFVIACSLRGMSHDTGLEGGISGMTLSLHTPLGTGESPAKPRHDRNRVGDGDVLPAQQTPLKG